MRSLFVFSSALVIALFLFEDPAQADGWICRQVDGTDLIINREHAGCKHLPDAPTPSGPGRVAYDRPSATEAQASSLPRKAECARRGAEVLKDLKAAFTEWQTGTLPPDQLDKAPHFSMKDCLAGR